MARSKASWQLAALLALLLAAPPSLRAVAQPQPQTEPQPQAQPQGQAQPELPAVAKECGEANAGETPLPNSAAALQARKQVKIMAIGASSTAVLGWRREGKPPLLEQMLERSVKGLDIEIINRGFSGELAQAAGARIKVEVALNHPDVVLWQVGTNDALAQVAVEEFEASVRETVRWLKAHNIDIILVGLHYMKQLATDAHYQAIRESLNRIAQQEHVLRIRRYEAGEILARTLREPGRPEPIDFGLSETGYNCMAQYVARAIAVGLFAKPAKQAQPAPTR
jgi:acyl-CoA thioesterase-1